MTEIITWVQTHWADVGAFILAVIGAASIIVRITPTPKDDEILGKIKAFVSKYLALNPKP